MFRILLLVVAARLLAWKAKFNDVGFTLIVLVCVTVRMTGREYVAGVRSGRVEIHHRVMKTGWNRSQIRGERDLDRRTARRTGSSRVAGVTANHPVAP